MTGESSLNRTRGELSAVLARINRLELSSRFRAFKFFLVYWKLKGDRLRKKLLRRLVCLCLIVAACLLAQTARSRYDSLKYSKCLVEQPSWTRHLFRPAVDCSTYCGSVQQVEKLSNIDTRTFEERYAYSGRPVVITDAAANWTAMELFSYSFFKELYYGQEANCQFFPYKTGFRSLQEVFNMSNGRALLQAGTEPWYVGWSNCDEVIGTILRRHYQRPYFLPDTAESEKTDWIFMGSRGYGAPMHVDDVEYPSWQAQIRGSKTWILEPPRECHYSCQRLQVTVNPGEIIILDTNKWYHQTQIVSEDISITIGAEYD